MPRDDTSPVRPGDVVRIWSGGPEMTVAGADTDTGWLTCVWWEGGDPGYRSLALPPEALEILPRER